MTGPEAATTASGLRRQATTTMWLERAVMTLWLVYLLVTPTVGLGWIDSWHNEQRAAQIVLLVLTAIVYAVSCLSAPAEVRRPRSPFPPWLLVVLSIGIVSALLAANRFTALAEVSLVVMLAALTLITAQFVSRDPVQAVRWARWFALLFAAAYVLGVAARFLAAVSLGRTIDLSVWILGYANPRFPSALHTVLIPLLAMTILETRERRVLRIGAAIVLPLIWTINVGLGTRGVWFAYALALPALIPIVGWPKVARLGGVVVAAALVGLLIYYALPISPTLPAAPAGGTDVRPASSLNLTLTSRDVLWRLSWDAIRASPALGLGPMQFASLGSQVGAHPHNWILQIAAEWGLPALLLLLNALIGLLRTARQERHGVDLAGPLLAIFAALCLGLVDGNLVMPVSQSAAALALGLLLGLQGKTEGESRSPSDSKSAVALSAFLCVAACSIILAYATSSVQEQETGALDFRRSNPDAWLVPRFWEQGLILE